MQMKSEKQDMPSGHVSPAPQLRKQALPPPSTISPQETVASPVAGAAGQSQSVTHPCGAHTPNIGFIVSSWRQVAERLLQVAMPSARQSPYVPSGNGSSQRRSGHMHTWFPMHSIPSGQVAAPEQSRKHAVPPPDRISPHTDSAVPVPGAAGQSQSSTQSSAAHVPWVGLIVSLSKHVDSMMSQTPLPELKQSS